MTPKNLSWESLFTGDNVTFLISNPMSEGEVLKAEASCVRPDGSRQVAVGKVVGRQGLLKFPLSMTAPGVYRFEWALKNAEDSPLVTGSRELALQPYQNDRALAKRAVIALQEAMGEEKVVDTDKSFEPAMYQESLGIEEEAVKLASLQAAAPGSAPAFGYQLNARTAALNTRAKRALALSSILTNAPDTPVIAFEGTTWENRDVDMQLPSEVSIPLRITRHAALMETV